jgi:hypothetical protein
MSDSQAKTLTILLATCLVLCLCLALTSTLSAVNEDRTIGAGVIDEPALRDILPVATPLETVVWTSMSRAETSKARTTAAWTFMVYLNGDNALDPFTFDAFNKMESAASNPNVSILVLWDRSGDGDTRRYKVKPDADLFQLASYTQDSDVWNLGELNMGQSQTLADFVGWASTHYTATHYALAIVGHGHGWPGVGWDDTSAGDELSLKELGNALSTATSNGANRVEVVFLDASLMAMAEVGYEIKDCVDYLVASENYMWAVFAYDEYFSAIGSATSPQDLAITITDKYHDAMPSYPRTISALNLTQMNNVASAIDSLAQALIARLPTYAAQISKARSSAQKFDSNGDSNLDNIDGYTDLYHFAQLVKQNVPNATIQNAAQGVMDAIGAAGGAFVSREVHESGINWENGVEWNLDNTHGISVYFPLDSSAAEYSDYIPGNLAFAASTRWDDFLAAYFALPGCPYPLSDVRINGPTSGYTDTLYAFTAVGTPSNATEPITYTWAPAPVSGQGTASASYQWTTSGGHTLSLVVENCGGAVSDTHSVTIDAPQTETYFETFTETFSTTTYLSPYSTAVWDTGTGNVRLPRQLSLVGSYDTSGYAWDVVVSGTLAYVADRDQGLQVIDVSLPTSPVLQGNLDTDGYAYGVAVKDDYAYVADGSEGLQVIDISVPATPTAVGSYDPGGTAWSITISGTYAYLGTGINGLDGLRIIDVSNPTTPTLVGSSSIRTSRVAIAGNYAYVAGYDSGFHVISITTPVSPTLVGSYNTPGCANGVAISRTYAYVADGYDGLQIIDISDPEHPAFTVGYDTSGDSKDVAVSGNYVYIADDDSGVQVVDISDPTHPMIAGSYDTSSYAYGISLSGPYAYVADGYSGLQVLEFQPELYALSGTVQSLKLNAESGLILTATLTVSQTLGAHGSVSYQLSNDGGYTWEDVVPEIEHTFASRGSDLRWRALIASADALHSPLIDEIIVRYKRVVVPGGTISLSSLPEVFLGESFIVEVWIESTPDLCAVQVEFGFDPSALQAQWVAPSWPWFDVPPYPSIIDNVTGHIQLYYFSHYCGDPSATGRVHLASIIFTSVDVGTTPVVVTGVSAYSSTGGVITTLDWGGWTPGTGSDSGGEATVLVLPSTLWTFMVYLNGDNDLDEETFDVFNRLESAANNPNLEIIVLWDRLGDGNTNLYKVKHDTNPFELASYTLDEDYWDRGELNMGSGRTLYDFVAWARNNYPARHYFLSLVDHGGGWAPTLPPMLGLHYRSTGGSAMSWDATSNHDSLSTSELGNVFQVLTSDGANKIDVVFYDACLMGMIENAYEIKDYASYFVASENMAWASWPYDVYVSSITSETAPLAFATNIVDEYHNSLAEYPRTMSAIDLAQINEVASTVDSLAQALTAGLPIANTRFQITEAYTATQKLDYDGDLEIEDTDGYVDLYHFAEMITQIVTDTVVVHAAQGVMNSMTGAVVAEQHQSGAAWYNGVYWNLENAHGLSIYLPLGEDLRIGESFYPQRHYTDDELSFAADTGWNEFIDTYYSISRPPIATAEPIVPQPIGLKVYLPLVERSASAQ